MRKIFIPLALLVAFGVLYLVPQLHIEDAIAHQPKLKIKQAAIYVVNGESSSISIIDAEGDSVVATIDMDDDGVLWPHHIAQSKDGLTLAIGVPGMDFSHGHGHGGMMTMEGKVVLVNSKTGRINDIITTPSMVHNAVITPNGEEVWTGYMSDKKIGVYNAKTGKLKTTIEVDQSPMDVQFSTSGKYAYVASQSGNVVDVIEVDSKKVVKRIPVGEAPIAPWVSANGFVYVTTEENPSLTIIDQSTNEAAPILKLNFPPGSAAAMASDQTHTVWVTDEKNGSVHLFRNGTEQIAEISCGAGSHAITFNEAGTKAYVTNQFANTVSVIDVASRKVIKTIPVGKKPNGILYRRAL
jgi:YVTN family beta-propeller protein